MSDLISRSAVLNELIEAKSQVSKVRTDYAEIINETLDIFANTINKQPAVDAVPVVHARWIYTGEMDEDGNCEANCSNCGAGDKHRADLKDAVPYCWKCGARMDGEADG